MVSQSGAVNQRCREKFRAVRPVLQEGFPPQATGVRAASPKEIPEGGFGEDSSEEEPALQQGSQSVAGVPPVVGPGVFLPQATGESSPVGAAYPQGE